MCESLTPVEPSIFDELQKKMMPFIKLQKLISQSTSSSNDFELILNLIQENNLIGENKGQIYEFLTLLSNSIEFHSKQIDLIEFLLKNYKETIQNNFNSDELFQIFSSNKTILLFLYEENLINIRTLQQKYQSASFQFPFFYPEFKSNFNILTSEQQEQILQIDKEIEEQCDSKIDNFLKLRKEGHSEMTIAKYIRDDDIDKFTVLVSPENFDLNMTIPLSIFESNSLLQSEPTLIEYACFFGSIKIFKFLWLHEIDLNKRIFTFAIAGNNLEIIHLIENKCKIDNTNDADDSKPKRKRFRSFGSDLTIDNDCLLAAIDYQKPEIFEYFIEKYNFLNLTEIMIPKIIKTHNFLMFNNILQYILKENPNCTMEVACNFSTKKESFSIDQILKMKLSSNKNFLHFACIYGNLKIVNFLCNYKSLIDNNNNEFLIDVNEKDKSNWAPLHYACKYDYLDIVKSLFDCYGNLLDANVEDDGLIIFVVLYGVSIYYSSIFLTFGLLFILRCNVH